MAPHPPKLRTKIPSYSPHISSPQVYKSGGCSISSLVWGTNVHGPDDMLRDSNIRSFPRPGRHEMGRCDIGDELSHHMILDAPNFIGDDVSIDNSQTPRGPNAIKHCHVNPSHREEI
nr:hypothetical protein [Tanacetum cinerariifolium]